MKELDDLYQQVILDHYKRPRNYGRPALFNREAGGTNPMCGDIVRVYAEVSGGMLRAVHFEGSGCAISTASASLMTEAVNGRTLQEFDEMFLHFQQQVIEKDNPGVPAKLAVFSGVRQFPARVKCATLPWHALRAALKCEQREVTTE